MNCCMRSVRSPQALPTRVPATTGTRATAPWTSSRRSTAAARSTARSSTSTATTTTRTAGAGSTSRNSRWLLHADTQVQLSLSVKGSGFVTSGVNGQECDDSCTTEWDAGTDIELVADARPGSASARGPAPAPGRPTRCASSICGATTVAGAVFRPLRRLALQITGARHRHELGRELLPIVLDAAGRGDAGRTPREGREGLAFRALERGLPWDSPRLRRPARQRWG